MNHFRTISGTRLCTNSLPAKVDMGAALIVASIITVLFAALGPSSVLARTSVSLTVHEHQVADQLARAQTWDIARSAPNTGQHPLGIQTLSIELNERKKGSLMRRARVYQFNYQSQQSRLVLIDLDKQAIVKQQSIDSIHLPLNTVEIQTARALVEQSAPIMAKLNQRRAIRGQSELSNLSTINVKASIFEPDDVMHRCATQRCALLSLFDETRTVLTVEPLVNLQSLSVTTLQQSF